MDKLNLGKNAFPPKLFDEMPDLQVQLFKGRAGAAGPSAEPEGMDYLDGDARNMAMILWAIKRHKGEQRMHSGVWKKVAWQHKPDWVGAPLLSPDQLRALERRTHPMGENDDPTDPVLYTDEEVADQTMLGLRPDPKFIINTFWADDGKSLWVRSTRTWALPALIHIYGHRYSFKYLWIAWSQMPVTIQSHRRGQNAPNSETARRLVKWKEIKQQADSFMKASGLDAPSTHDEWVAIFKEMGKFMATKAFMTRTPTPVMELPIAPLHDSKEALRFRAICDERITLPLLAFAEHLAIHESLTKELPLDAMVDVK